MDEIQAAILRIKLSRLDADNQRRNRIANYYLNNINHPSIILPKQNLIFETLNQKLSHVWHLFIIRSSKRNLLQQYLSDNDIQTLIHYPIPPHQQKAYKEWNDLNFPISEQIHHEVLSLPISQVMKNDETIKVVDIINSFSI